MCSVSKLMTSYGQKNLLILGELFLVIQKNTISLPEWSFVNFRNGNFPRIFVRIN